MQKSYTISCCAECPAFISKDSFCAKEERVIKQDASSPVDLTLLGFPEWCPIPDVEIVGGSLSIELKRIARQILRRLDLDSDDDSVTYISHYLSTVVDIKNFKGDKDKIRSPDLFDTPVTLNDEKLTRELGNA
jgi:hypothetical protein